MFCSVSLTVDVLLLILVDIRFVDRVYFLFSVPSCFLQNIYVTSLIYVYCFRVLYCVANFFEMSPMICTFFVRISEFFSTFDFMNCVQGTLKPSNTVCNDFWSGVPCSKVFAVQVSFYTRLVFLNLLHWPVC